jgi:hypothetical protein
MPIVGTHSTRWETFGIKVRSHKMKYIFYTDDQGVVLVLDESSISHLHLASNPGKFSFLAPQGLAV